MDPAGAYLTVAIAIGAVWGRRLVEGGIRAWLDSNRPPTEAEKLRVLRAPLRVLGVAALLWALAVVAFTLLNLPSTRCWPSASASPSPSAASPPAPSPTC